MSLTDILISMNDWFKKRECDVDPIDFRYNAGKIIRIYPCGEEHSGKERCSCLDNDECLAYCEKHNIRTSYAKKQISHVPSSN